MKNWSVTLGLAAIIAVNAEKVTLTGRIAILVAAFSTVPFWITDAFWKSYQTAYLNRLEILEQVNTCTDEHNYVFGIVSAWQQAHDWYDWIGILFWPSVALPHVFILLTGLYLAWKHPPTAPSSKPGSG